MSSSRISSSSSSPTLKVSPAQEVNSTRSPTLHLQLAAAAVVEQLAVADRLDHAPRRLLLGRVGQDDAARRPLFARFAADDHAVAERLELEVESWSPSFLWSRSPCVAILRSRWSVWVRQQPAGFDGTGAGLPKVRTIWRWRMGKQLARQDADIRRKCLGGRRLQSVRPWLREGRCHIGSGYFSDALGNPSYFPPTSASRFSACSLGLGEQIAQFDRRPALPFALVGGFHEGVDFERFLLGDRRLAWCGRT